MTKKNVTVAVAMSGGVDSSVSAYLLKKQGYDVFGISMKVCDEVDITDEAKEIADKIGIPFYKIDLIEDFKKSVINHFADEYTIGRTPNPCVECNKKIKFGLLLRKAKELGADFIATGHYANIKEENGRYLIYNAKDANKDQTYMMYGLKQEVLKYIMFPNGDYSKNEIRKIAKEIGMEVHNKKDSMEICFIPDNNHSEYIEKKLKRKQKKGYFKDIEGNVVGEHNGIIKYTIGQRKGLGLSLGKPIFVVDINPDLNEVVVGPENLIFREILLAKDFNFIPFDRIEGTLFVEAKIRYSARRSLVQVTQIDDDNIKVVFNEAQRAITKGQSVVFYENEKLIGGAIIEDVL
ncbi:tRNA 2-thiouridine(34) synthase MnmA [Clostridium sp. DL1XJH146]